MALSGDGLESVVEEEGLLVHLKTVEVLNGNNVRYVRVRVEMLGLESKKGEGEDVYDLGDVCVLDRSPSLYLYLVPFPIRIRISYLCRATMRLRDMFACPLTHLPRILWTSRRATTPEETE